MLAIYFKPHVRRVREATFVSWLQEHMPDAQLIPNNYPVARSYLNCALVTQELIEALKADHFLPQQRRQQCIELLRQCPASLKIALDPTRISFDVVVERDGQPYFWEFHEEQHWKLTVTRTQVVYDAQTNMPVQVPRYLQRLIRDMWRMTYFRPYTIVWHDWFTENRERAKPELRDGLHEFFLPGRFSFSHFWRQT